MATTCSCEARQCRFGLNGRNLILQAAQRAAKKRKRSHSASQNSECSKVATRVTSSDASNAAHAQQVTQSAQVTNPEGEARATERIDSQANSGTAQPLKKHGTAASSAAPRRGATPSTAAPDALIDGLDPRDQPLVAYINRSSVPRILRQVGPLIYNFTSATRSCTLHSNATM